MLEVYLSIVLYFSNAVYSTHYLFTDQLIISATVQHTFAGTASQLLSSVTSQFPST